MFLLKVLMRGFKSGNSNFYTIHGEKHIHQGISNQKNLIKPKYIFNFYVSRMTNSSPEQDWNFVTDFTEVLSPVRSISIFISDCLSIKYFANILVLTKVSTAANFVDLLIFLLPMNCFHDYQFLYSWKAISMS